MRTMIEPDEMRDQELICMVNEHQTALLRMCYMLLNDRDLAQDAVQDTFIRAYKGLPTFRGECSQKHG